MVEQNSQTGNAHSIIIVILALALIGALSFVFWQNFLQPKDKKTQDSSINKPTNENKYETISQSELESIVVNQLDLLNDKTNLNQITNQEKLRLAVKLYGKNHPYAEGVYQRTITVAEIEDTLNNTSIKSDDLVHESIKCITATNPAHNEYEYNSTTKTYSNANHGGHGGGGNIYAVYSKPSDFKNSDGQYSISYKYVFGIAKEFGSDTDSVFGTYANAASGANPVHVFKADANVNNGMVDTRDESKYIEENYGSLEDKLSTYIYTFKKTDGKIKITGFSIK